ncbi:hypothetical protein DEEACLCL_00081 [Salmonella phage CRW-SP2]|nr:hypothetical protein DEEACLCL_00081 [Salmonella phage CRW-SP2]
MKMRKSEHFVRSSSSIAGQTFSVKMSDKLFETLFSTLYKYKEAAAIRETTCNAIDSHNMRDRQQNFVASHYVALTPSPARYSRYLAPKGTPVIVHLPDDMEPWLEIKDFGIGLSLEQIVGEPIMAQEDEVLIEGNVVVKEDEIPENSAVIGVPDYYGDRLVFRREDGEIIRTPGLYTTLFNSTKENDDGQIGAFGLGSKSPFAVSDSFTVESRYEGQLYRFLMYLNQDRIPTVDVITKDLETRDPKPEDTEEFNGVTVRIPIKNSRYSAFAEELRRLGKVMKPEQRPVVDNSYGFTWPEIDFSNRVGNTYIQRKGDSDHTHYAVMGGVSYPISLDQLDPNIQSVLSRFPSSYTFVELGELNVPPSREDLSYDQYTRDSLNRILHKVVDSIMDMHMTELRLAQSRGPLALYMAKVSITDIYGSGFRKMLEKEFPSDIRFHDDKFQLTGIPTVEREWSEDAPFSKLGYPFDIEIHEGFAAETTLYATTMSFWADKGIKPLIIIDDSNHARNLKIATAKTEHQVVIVVKPKDNLLAYRNSAKLSKGFKNKEEIVAFLESWAGTKDTFDYLALADKFYESIDGLITPIDVRMMSELKFVRPTVEKDPGMFPFSRDDHFFKMDKWRELKASDVSEMIDSGKLIVYVEMSGHECIHKIFDRPVKEDAVAMIHKTMGKTKFETTDDNGVVSEENMYSFMNIHETFVLARRKSVPMMKKHPEVFISISDVFDLLVKHNESMVKYTRAAHLLKMRNKVKIMADRLKYGEHLLSKAFGEDSEEFLKYRAIQDLHNQLHKEIDNAIPEDKVRYLRSVLRRKEFKNPKLQTQYRFLLESIKTIGCDVNKDPLTVKVKQLLDESENKFYEATNVLHGNGFKDVEVGRAPRLQYRRENRLAVERHRVIQFLRKNYKPTMENPFKDQGTFLEIISRSIVRV